MDILSTLRIDHIMLGVSNFDETIQWYEEKLGFKEVRRWMVEELPGVQLAYLELNNFYLEICTSNQEQALNISSDFASHFLETRGYGHLCFWVEDVDAVMTEMKQPGVAVFFPATDDPQGAERCIALIQDNNEHLIEFAGPLLGTQSNQ